MTNEPWYEQIRNRVLGSAPFAPKWLLVLGGIVLAFLLGLLSAATPNIATALLGLIGVALGGIISAIASFRSAEEAQRAQIVTKTWPERLKVHQEGFTRWLATKRVMNSPTGDDKRLEVLEEDRDWWDRNCLYLSEEARDAFFNMILAAYDRPLLVHVPGPKDPRSVSDVKENAEVIMKAGTMLLKGAHTHMTDEMLNKLATREVTETT